jgi:hypothetical protein
MEKLQQLQWHVCGSPMLTRLIAVSRPKDGPTIYVESMSIMCGHPLTCLENVGGGQRVLCQENAASRPMCAAVGDHSLVEDDGVVAGDALRLLSFRCLRHISLGWVCLLRRHCLFVCKVS